MRTTISIVSTVLLFAATAAGQGPSKQDARSTAADWQTTAKGMTEGRLCSLVLQVEVGKTLDLLMPGGSRDAGWGKIGPTTVGLGTITLPGKAAPEEIHRSGDWSAGQVVASFPGGGRITVHVSQMSPGIAVEFQAPQIRLFAGQHEQFIDAAAQHGNWVLGFPGGQNHRSGTVTPAWAAVHGQKGIKVSAIDKETPLPPADQPWMLLGWGDATHFVRSDCPLAGRGRQSDAYRADCPLLVVFHEAPQAIRVAEGGGLDISFRQTEGRLAILPLAGAGLLRAADTQKWLGGVPEEIEAQCRRLAGFASWYPVGVSESFHYDAAGDEAAFTDKFQYLAIAPGGRKFAPLPPIAALARQGGMAVSADAPLADLAGPSCVTEFGPMVGAADKDAITWKVKGLGKYVDAKAPSLGQGKAPAALEEELGRRVRDMAAGKPIEPWRPWTYVDNIPISRARGDYYWGEPGEALALLALLHPVLGSEEQKAVAESMSATAAAYPPWKTPLIPADAGKPRGGYDVGPCDLSKTIAKERGSRVGVFALYGLERHLGLLDGKPAAESWEECKTILAEAFEEQAWATLYLLGRPHAAMPWEKDKVQGAATPSWRGDRPGAVVNVNRTFAGAVGAVRLARAARDADTEQRAWWLLARAATARVAMGKLPGWRYKAGLCILPKDPQWQWKLEAGTWHGNLQTPDWSKPEDDVRQVVGLSLEGGVRLDDAAGTSGDLWLQEVTSQLPAFRYMMPETAALLRDRLRPETAMLVARIEQNLPTWYASFSEAILGAEHSMNHPSDAFEVFLARAWVLDEPPDRLQRWIDVPWLDTGDLFYLNKLAETIRAYRARK